MKGVALPFESHPPLMLLDLTLRSGDANLKWSGRSHQTWPVVAGDLDVDPALYPMKYGPLQDCRLTNEALRLRCVVPLCAET